MSMVVTCTLFFELVFSVHPIIAELTLHSGALSDNRRVKLGGTVSSRCNLLDIRIDALSFIGAIKAALMSEPCDSPNSNIM